MPVTIGENDTQVVSLDELKDHLNIDSSRDDGELMLTLGAAVEAVEGIIGPILHREVTEPARTWTGTLALQQSPVVSVTTLTASDSPVTYSLDTATGILRDVASTAALSVTYVAGRTVVPDAVRLAILIIAGHLWKTQLGSAPSTSLQGVEDFAPDLGLGYAIPSRAQDLLAPYALPPTVA